MNGWALRAVLARFRPQWAILAVVLAVCLLAATLLAGLALLVDSSQRFGVRSALGRAGADDTRVSVRVEVGGLPYPAAQRDLDASLRRLFAGVPTTSTIHLISTVGAVTSPAAPDHGVYGWLTYFADYDAVATAATLLDGHWPGAADPPAQPGATGTTGTTGATGVAIPRRLAQDLGLKVGDRFTVGDPVGTSRVATVITGIYQVPAHPDPAVWGDDPLEAQAFQADYPVPYTPRTTAQAYGPLITTPAAFSSQAVRTGTIARRELPALSRLPLTQLHPLAVRAGDVGLQMRADLSQSSVGVQATTQLAGTLGHAERFLAVTRGSILVTALMLLVLSLAALLLAARLLAERRLTEQSLMRARGASGGQLLRLAIVEAWLLAGLVAVTAPPLARLLYLALARRPDFVAAGMDVDPGVPGVAWLTAAGACLIFVLVLVGPLLRRSSSFVEQEQQHARPDRRTAIQRSGLDLAVGALAAGAYWQLHSYQSPLTGSGGAVRTDPVLVAGPALALLAGALVTVRVVPVLARLLEVLAARGRSVAAPLAAWEVGRRSRRAVGAVLLLSLALAVGTFGLSFLSTWRASQQDQADFQVGADVRIRTDPQARPLGTAHALAATPGAGTLLPVALLDTPVADAGDLRRLFDPDENTTSAQLLAVPAGRVGPLLDGRVLAPGGAAAPASAALPGLAATEPVHGVPLPGAPTSVSARVTATGQPAVRLTSTVRLVLQDATGARQVATLGQVPVDGAGHLLRADLLDAGARVTPPLQLVAVQTEWGPPRGASPPAQGLTGPLPVGLMVDQVRLTDPDRLTRPLTLDAPVDWRTSSTTSQPDGPVTGTAGPAGTVLSGHLLLPAGAAGNVGGDDRPGRFAGPATLAFTTWRPDHDPIGAVASSALMADRDSSAGDDVAIRVGDSVTGVRVGTVVPYFPGLDPGRPQLVLDYDALSRRLIEQGEADLPVTEWWAQVPTARAAGYAAAVTATGIGTATSRAGLGRELQQQPLRVGIQGALWLIVVAAVGFAAIGFAMHTTVAVRLRRVEFSQLRALGITRRSLNAVVGLENLMLGTLGVGCGIGLGALLALLVAPLVSLAADGSRPIPGVLVHIPWAQVAGLAGAVCGLLAVILLVVSQVLRTSALGAVLRLGDER